MLQKCSCFRRDAVRSPKVKEKSQKLHSGKKWFLKWITCDSKMSPPSAENTIRAALLIQKWYRSYLARMEMRRRYSWTIFQSIEYNTEQDQVKLYNFFNALLMHMPNEGSESQEGDKANLLKESKTTSVELELEDWEDKNYECVRIGNQVSKTDVEDLINLFRKRKDNKLRTKYVARLLIESTNCLKKFPNLNIASTAISKQVTICGDIHGKLEDLLVIFHKNGLPSRENPYIFNGDFVDRGKKSLEVLLLLLACILAFPGGIYLNRGNHEDSVMNARYGFIREVNNKYKKNGERLMKLIEEVYRWLPLGTLINNKILVVHGGISDTTDLNALKKLDRSKYTSILRPPVAEQGAGGIDKGEWKQIFDVMWSDPQRNDGCEPNTLRSAGTYFGPDITKSFLEKHGLDYIIRSHECKPNGYEVVHSGQVITIFSASNYYAVGSNKGAYLKVNPKLDTHFVQFTAEASRAKKLTFREKVGLVEDSAMKELGKMLSDKKNDIAKEFKKIDKDNTGVISITQWCHALELATNLGLPWRLLKDKLAPEDDPANANSKTVHYQKTLEILSSEQFKMDNSTISVTSSLYKNRSSLEAIFKILDKDNSGYITLDEFGDACDLLSEFLPESDNKEQILELCKMMDMNKDGQVDLNEFLEAFRLCEQASKDGNQESEDL